MGWVFIAAGICLYVRIRGRLVYGKFFGREFLINFLLFILSAVLFGTGFGMLSW